MWFLRSVNQNKNLNVHIWKRIGKALMQDCKHIMHNLIKMSFYFRSDQWKWENFFAVFLTAI